MAIFLICTIANDLLQYEAMKASFLAAGFDEERCRYHLFDNSRSNSYDPYSAINSAVSEADEPYIIFCHQDILLDQGHGIEDLRKIVTELNSSDPAWAVLGNAGVTEDHRLLRNINDPMGNDYKKDLAPERACTLDENFLVIKTSSKLRCSDSLNGFHLYAADLCLQAQQQQHSCYVVNFHLTHLSPGKIDQSFQVARQSFQRRWSNKYRFVYVHTPCTSIFLSRNPAVRWFFSSSKIGNWLFSDPRRHNFVCRFSDRIQPDNNV